MYVLSQNTFLKFFLNLLNLDQLLFLIFKKGVADKNQRRAMRDEGERLAFEASEKKRIEEEERYVIIYDAV